MEWGHHVFVFRVIKLHEAYVSMYFVHLMFTPPPPNDVMVNGLLKDILFGKCFSAMQTYPMHDTNTETDFTSKGNSCPFHFNSLFICMLNLFRLVVCVFAWAVCLRAVSFLDFHHMIMI